MSVKNQLGFKIKHLEEDIEKLRARLLVLEPWAEKAMEVLEERQWNDFDFSKSVSFCSSCQRTEDQGHKPSCAIAELLRGE